MVTFTATGTGDSTVLYNMAGQIRSSAFIPGVTPTPYWTGNIIASYLVGDFSTSLSARYIGGAKLDNTWCDTPGQACYKNAAGQFLTGSVDDNHVDPYLNFSLNASYALKVANMKRFEVFGSINNLFDKSPPWTAATCRAPARSSTTHWVVPTRWRTHEVLIEIPEWSGPAKFTAGPDLKAEPESGACVACF